MIKKALTAAILIVGMSFIPAYAAEQEATQPQAVVPNWFDPSTWVSAYPSGTGSTGTFNWFDPSTWATAPQGYAAGPAYPGGPVKFNLAHPEGWAVFMNPATYAAMMNPATYGQFLNPQFYMQFANPNNWLAWMNPAAYGAWMNPATYTQLMNPAAYMAFMNPVTYMQWMNPANYMAFMNPMTYLQWMNPAAYTIGDVAGTSGGTGGTINWFDPSTWSNLTPTQPQPQAQPQPKTE